MLYCIISNGNQVAIPAALEDLLIVEYYDQTEFIGIDRTLSWLAAKYWFTHMARKVKTYV